MHIILNIGERSFGKLPCIVAPNQVLQPLDCVFTMDPCRAPKTPAYFMN